LISNKSPPSINFFGIDVRSKTLKFNVSDSKVMETVDYDPEQKRMVGIGLDVHAKDGPVRTIVTLDGTTGKFEETCKFPGYFIINGGTAAFSPKGREVFAFLASSHSKTAKPMYLVSINTSSCHTRQTTGCAEPASCPWNLGFRM
jgi:hypothetical protein